MSSLINPIIIAEIGWNHMGDMNLAKKMIKEASNAGAAIAKFQTWNVNRLKKGEWDLDGRREIYNKAELSREDHKYLINVCNQNNIEFMSSVFSIEDAKLLLELNLESVKIPSFEVSNKELLEFCKINFKQIFVSTGTATEDEIIQLKNIFKNLDGKIIVLHCVSAYPCEASSINLPRINHLRKYFDNVGFSDHTQGIMTTLASINYSPVAIEKHFTVDHNLPGRDNKFAILPNELDKINQFIITTQDSAIDHGINFQSIELSSRSDYRGRFNG